MKHILSIFTVLIFSAVSLLGQAGAAGTIWSITSGTLQSAAVANGNGTVLTVTGYAVAEVTVNCTVACSGGTTINFEGSQDGTNFVALSAFQLGTSTVATIVANQGTTPTVWTIPLSALTSIRARISAYSAGTITVTAQATTAPFGPTAGPAGQTTMSASVPVAVANDQSGTCDSTAFYDASTTGATQLVAISGTKTIYICGFNFTTASTTAVNVGLVYGTGTNCATGQNKITPAYPLQAATSVSPIGIQVTGPALSKGLQTASGNALCINVSGAQAVQGLVWYKQL